MNLGIVFDNEMNVINHRSLLKVFINPFLRCFGVCIATKFDGNELGGLTILKSKPTKLHLEKYQLKEGEFVLSTRRLF